MIDASVMGRARSINRGRGEPGPYHSVKHHWTFFGKGNGFAEATDCREGPGLFAPLTAPLHWIITSFARATPHANVGVQ